MSGKVRRRAPSPQPGQSLPTSSQRFPHAREDHLDADARREAASKGLTTPGRKSYPPGGLKLTSGEWKLLAVVVIVAAGVRLFRLSRPNSVVFDEVHFGKFASKYIKTQYFVDVHPPLAKLLITLAAFVFGYDGKFDFKDIAKVYDHVPYVAMRMVPATLGVATVPLSYLTLRALDCRATTALLASLFITFENGMITQSRHILLDSPLIFFTALTIFLWVGFCNEDKHEPFTNSWWTWLFLSGLSLGAVVSCKWVGLFTIATIGLSTLLQLWNLLGDLRTPPRVFIRHFMARALCLILVPILFYMAMFSIHFAILGSSGDGDGFMSSEFQHTLGGRQMADTFADVSFGSEVTIRHVNTQGGYLHSHPHTYPGGSKQQQITLYPHRDQNNNWRIFNASREDDRYFEWENDPITYIRTGTVIKLRHLNTEKHLHSHDFRPPVSEVDFQNEVSAYGMPNFVGDANDDWVVEISQGDKRDRESSKRLRTLRTKFRLRHSLTGCYLFSHKVKLPDWAYEQQEVTCNKNAVKANSLWFIETNTHPKLPANAEKVNYKLPGFFAKFIELQRVMWRTNAGLTDRHTFDSRPESWPSLRRGINFWVKDHRQIYLIGNPIVWWLSTLSVLAYMSVRGFLILRAKRGYRDFDNTKVVKYDTLCGFLFIGWFLHYFPFFLMSRQLFLHHYFPALYFAILLSCGVFDLITSTLRPRVRLQIAAVLIIIAIWNFAHFSPLAYGNAWTKAKCNNAKWLKTWDFSCNEFLDDYSLYQGNILATPQKSAVPLTTIGGEPGGRAPVVVEDHAAVAKDVEEHTSIFVDKAEPGRDIFGDKPEQVKSQAQPQVVAPPPAIPAQEKEISSVLTQPQQQQPQQMQAAPNIPLNAPPASASVQQQTQSSSSSSLSSSISVDSGSLSSSDTETPSTAGEASTAEDVRLKTDGPLLEAEAEADRVAQELYADADVKPDPQD